MLFSLVMLFSGCVAAEPMPDAAERETMRRAIFTVPFDPELEPCGTAMDVTLASLVYQLDTLAAETPGEVYGLAATSYGTVLWQRNPHAAATPASVMKLLTGLATLDVLGPDYPITLGEPHDSSLAAYAGAVIDWENPLPLTEALRFTLLYSVNNYADILLTHLGPAYGLSATIAGGTEALTLWLDAHGLLIDDPVLLDGSGLSPGNRISPTLVVNLIRWAMADRHDAIRELLTYLPLSGVSGTLTGRFAAEPDAVLRVRAKTGTLPGVSALAGVTPQQQAGVWTVFAVFINDAPVGSGVRQAYLDAMVGAMVCLT
ncbi:MAG: D-alanyl-D-alanine carboxypeptidase [Propionibacteriaceae bacterium]|jgi:D-alanyl-D-alanine carboxypeptidase|nr:D-alanyl-D-alanine carboxypeptidase [Propionibacteriaceae bacterium]